MGTARIKDRAGQSILKIEMVLPKEALILQFLAQFHDRLGYDGERVRILLKGLGNHHAIYENERGFKPQYLIKRDLSHQIKMNDGTCVISKYEEIVSNGECRDQYCHSNSGYKYWNYVQCTLAKEENCLVVEKTLVKLPGRCVFGSCHGAEGAVEEKHKHCRQTPQEPAIRFVTADE